MFVLVLVTTVHMYSNVDVACLQCVALCVLPVENGQVCSHFAC